MKNYFNYDFINKAIVGSKAAIRKANTGNTAEYRELTAKLAEHPDFKVVQKEIKENTEKKKYNGLTFDRMKEYILTQNRSVEKLLEFEAVKKVAEAKGAKYPITKKWFLNEYPEYKTNEATINEEEILKKAAEKIAALDNEMTETDNGENENFAA